MKAITHELISRYLAGPEKLRAALSGLSEDDLRFQYDSAKWSAKEIAIHIADMDAVASFRMKRIISEPDARYPGVDQDLWALGLGYQSRDVEPSLHLLEANRREMAAILTTVAESAWNRQGVHESAGQQTLRGLVVSYTEHLENHVAQIVAIRQRLRPAMPTETAFALPEELLVRLRAIAAGHPNADRLTELATFIQAVDARFSTCMIWQRSTSGLTLMADVGEHHEECPLPSRGGISQQAVETNQSVLMGNNKAAERTIECYLFAGSEMAVPIPTLDGQTWGAIHVQSEQIEAFTSADRTLFTAIAAVCGAWLSRGT